MLIVCLYVDDLIFTGDYGIAGFISVIESDIEMSDFGLMKFLWELKSNNIKVVYLYHS